MTGNSDTEGICVIFEGFDGVSFGESSGSSEPDIETGMDILADRIRDKNFGFQVIVHEHEDQEEAIESIEEVLIKTPSAKLVIMGHSLGGDSALETAELLGQKEIEVDLLIQIDSVGAFDDEKPANVKRGVNIFSTSRDGIEGEKHIEGSINIGLDDTSHTDIDNDLRTHDCVIIELEKLLGKSDRDCNDIQQE